MERKHPAIKQTTLKKEKSRASHGDKKMKSKRGGERTKKKGKNNKIRGMGNKTRTNGRTTTQTQNTQIRNTFRNKLNATTLATHDR